MTKPEPLLLGDDSVPQSPMELLRSGNAGRLTDEELLAVILGTGRSGTGVQRLLARNGIEALAGGSTSTWWWSVLSSRQGIRLAAAIELSNRLAVYDSPSRPRVNGPQDVFDVTSDLRFKQREHFVGLYLNARNRLLSRKTISVGSLNASIVHPREVFAPALRHGAASLIVVHNHPSGETDPSGEDVELSRRLSEAGDILGIELLDHVIVGRSEFTSLKEAGHL